MIEIEILKNKLAGVYKQKGHNIVKYQLYWDITCKNK